MIHGIKIVSSETMQELEKGLDTDVLMDAAGEALYALIQDYCPGVQSAVLLVGKGKNGGDALTLGTLLLRAGVKVFARLLYPTYHPRYEQFKKAGGALHTLEPFSLLVDGITGSGFHGTPDTVMFDAINWANAQHVPILAIDMPSGLDGSTGHVATVAIAATVTCSLGLPKIGCFIEEGWDRVGRFVHADIGLPAERLEAAEPLALLFKDDLLPIPPILRSQHKYSRGYVLGIGGCPEMPGAAALSSLAALRGGAGIVRLFTRKGTPREVLAPEVICETWDKTRILEEMQRADSLFIGPGLGKEEEAQQFVHALLPHLDKPTVFDGDALHHLAPPQDSILTPHRGEMATLLGKPPSLDTCMQWADKHRVTVILKGAPTFIFHPGKKPLVITAGDPGMATAGAGDVLTGILAALLAQKLEPQEAAVLAVYLHGLSGEIAAREKSSYSMIASDLIDFLPDAWKRVICVQ